MSNTIAFILIIAIPVVLQIYLSKAESPWPGLLLPALSFILAILRIFSLVVFEPLTLFQRIMHIIITLLSANIPTLILLAIYALVRENKKKHKSMNSELEKMNIKDL